VFIAEGNWHSDVPERLGAPSRYEAVERLVGFFKVLHTDAQSWLGVLEQDVQAAAAIDQRLVQDTGSYDGTDDERVLSWGVEVTPVVGSAEADGLL